MSDDISKDHSEIMDMVLKVIDKTGLTPMDIIANLVDAMLSYEDAGNVMDVVEFAS